MAKLEGLAFLKANEIKKKRCDLDHPFAFISYAHDEHDTEIVRNVFQKLFDKGYNLWIDTANIPKDENDWSEAATDALAHRDETENRTCKLVLFFRSEESVIRKPILDELTLISDMGIRPIVTIDIWHDNKTNAGEYYEKNVKITQGKKLHTLVNIYKIVNKNNSAIRLQDLDSNNIDALCEQIKDELEENGVNGVMPNKSLTKEKNSQTSKEPTAQAQPEQQASIPSAPDTLPQPTNDIRPVRLSVLKDNTQSSGGDNSASAAAVSVSRERQDTLKLDQMIQLKIISAGDEVYVRKRPDSTATITASGMINYNGSEYSLNNYVPQVLGPGSRSAYQFVVHKKSGKTLDQLRKEYDPSDSSQSAILLNAPVLPAADAVYTENRTDFSEPSSDAEYKLVTTNSVCAVVKITDGSYTLLKGSVLKRDCAPSIPSKARKIREESSRLNSDGNRVVFEDVITDSPSSIASAITGCSTNGVQALEKARSISVDELDKYLRII